MTAKPPPPAPTASTASTAPPATPANPAPAPTRRPSAARRALLGGGLVAGLAGLVDLIDFQLAEATEADRPAPDGRPAMTGTAPVLFIGHGSPMNLVQDNAFTRHLRAWGQRLGTPRAIAVVSAHWLTEGQLAVSVDPHNGTLHDYGGFPARLYALRYPAPGAPELAQQAATRLGPRLPLQQPGRGLDHGAWAVLHHLYPAAQVPVFQVSIDITRGGAHQQAVGRALAALRAQGVLIIGSGNVVHNLGDTQRGAPDSPRGLTAWADDFDQRVKQALDAGDHAALQQPLRLGPHGAHAVPYPDHYWPLLTALGAAQSHERAQHVFEGFQSGTLSMRCVQWG